MPGFPGDAVLLVYVGLIAEDGPEETEAGSELIEVGEDTLAAGDGDEAVDRRR